MRTELRSENDLESGHLKDREGDVKTALTF